MDAGLIKRYILSSFDYRSDLNWGKLMRCSLVGLFLAGLVVATSAQAFEEQSQGGPKDAGSPSAGISGDKAAPPKANDGTIVAIPGLGKLGVIPKLDFGLELLYGDEAAKAPALNDDKDTTIPSDDDGLRIRGSIKHRF